MDPGLDDVDVCSSQAILCVHSEQTLLLNIDIQQLLTLYIVGGWSAS